MFLLAELVAALKANDPDTFKRWLYGGIEDLGEAAVTELLLDWLEPFLTVEEQDRLLDGQMKRASSIGLGMVWRPRWAKKNVTKQSNAIKSLRFKRKPVSRDTIKKLNRVLTWQPSTITNYLHLQLT